MTMLGIDTSMAITSACLLMSDGSDRSAPAPPVQRLFEPPRHSAELLPIVDELLSSSGVSWNEIESIAVGVGPGTFTGLRIGVSTARALGQALGVPLRPVSSLEALAGGMAAASESGRSMLGLIDARRGEVFAALFTDGQAEWGPLAISPQELVAAAADSDRPVLAAGDWALESKAALEAAGVEVARAGSGLHCVSARQLCLIGIDREAVDPREVEPLYVRLPDAEINRRSAGGNAG